MKKDILLLFVLLLSYNVWGTGVKDSGVWVEDLRCEGLTAPFGVDVLVPQLSWVVSTGADDVEGINQSYYQIMVSSSLEKLGRGEGDFWDSGKVKSEENIRIFYGGKTLSTGDDCYWKVRVWDDKGRVSPWSVVSRWSMGILSPKEWTARWVVHQSDTLSYPWFRKTFELSSDVKKAKVFVNTPGLFELYINGKKVGADVLSPAYSQYQKRIFSVGYDVSKLLHPGKNCIGLWLAPGWYQPRYGAPYNSPIVRAQLLVETSDGIQTVTTDKSWLSHNSCIRQVGQWGWNDMGGECWDDRLYESDWNLSDFEAVGWNPVKEVASPMAEISWLRLSGNKIIEKKSPVKVYKHSSGKWVIDFGTTLTGWMHIDLNGLRPGQEIIFDYADLDQPSLMHMPNSDGFQSFNQQDRIVAGKKSEVSFCSKFNQHAFRYVVITGIDSLSNIGHVEALPIMTFLPLCGKFRCSNELYNRIYEVSQQTFCSLIPNGVFGAGESREKEGYGDGANSLTGFLYNFDCRNYLKKWLDDWCDAQREDGFITHTAPRHADHGGGPAWGGTASELVERLYLYYGDKQSMEKYYDALKKYVNYIETHTENDILRYYSPYGVANEWSFIGDWLAPVTDCNDHGFVFETRSEQEFFNNCYRVILWQQLADYARVIGDIQEISACQERLRKMRSSIHKVWYDVGKGTYTVDRQAYLAIALKAHIMPDNLRPQIMKRLEEAIRKKDYHLDTGMHGTRMLMETLMEENRDDLIAKITNQETYPSWGFLIKKRHVTTWPETWTGWGSQVIGTIAHDGSWFYKRLAGICPDPSNPGFKHILIRPVVVEEVDWVDAYYDSIYGRIVSCWKREGDRYVFHIVIPNNCTATVTLPGDRKSRNIRAGIHEFEIRI